MTMMSMVPEIWNTTENFLPFWTIFYPFTSLTTLKFKILKKRKKRSLEILSFYTCVPKMTIIWFMVPEISSTTEIFLSFWTIFCPFSPLIIQKLKFKKNEKNIWSYYFFTHMYHKWQSSDVWFLRYGVWQTEFFVI